MKFNIIATIVFLTFGMEAFSKNACLRFYSEEICIDYSKHIRFKEKVRLTDSYFGDFFKYSESNGGDELYHKLNTIYDTKGLNDWLFYELASSLSKEVYNDQNKQTLLNWFLLSKHGYRTQLIYSKKNIFIKIYSNFLSPDLLKNDIDETYKWIYLGSEVKKKYPETYLSELKKYPDEYEVFSLDITKVPSLKDMVIEQKEVKFVDSSGEEHILSISFNKTYLNMLNSMPRPSNSAYKFYIPLSQVFEESLKTEFSSYLKELSEEEKIRFFLSISRTAKEYKKDIYAYGVVGKPLSFEEALYYPYNDCEDKSAILGGLTQLFLNTPFVVLNYPSNRSLNQEGHVNIAISFPYDKEGTDFIIHNERKYILLEPSDGNDISGIGYGGELFEKVPHKIIYDYEPQN